MSSSHANWEFTILAAGTYHITYTARVGPVLLATVYLGRHRKMPTELPTYTPASDGTRQQSRHKVGDIVYTGWHRARYGGTNRDGGS